MSILNFWEKLQKPIFILAPMDGVTDTVFRQIVAQVGRPDVFFTEFVPVDAIVSPAQQKVIEKSLRFTEMERPIVAQIWGSDPGKFYEAAKLLSGLKFDGIDINMGCPDKATIKKGACSALIKNPKLAESIILATMEGANGLPVSVKTRIGFESIETEKWVSVLLQTPISALSLHLRTVAEMSKVPAHWEEIEKAVKIRDELGSKTLIIGNGDIKTLEEAKEKCNRYRLDGVMIGTGIFENVYLFNDAIDAGNITPKQKLDLLLQHLKLFEKTWPARHANQLAGVARLPETGTVGQADRGDNRHFDTMKKFVKCYVNNFRGAGEKREILMKTKNLHELIDSSIKVRNQISL